MNRAEALQQAADYLRAGRLEAARQILVELLKREPGSDQAWYLLSFAVTDRAQQVECLQRALRVNPANDRARARLNLLMPKASPPPKTAPFTEAPALEPAAGERVRTGPTPASRRRRARPREEPPQPAAAPPAPAGRSGALRAALALLGLTLVCAIAVGAYAAYTYLSARNQERLEAEATSRAEVAIALATSGGSLSLPPTWTPSITPTATLTPTLTLTPTETPTPTFMPPDATIAAQMESIEREVADLRGLGIEVEIPRYLITKLRVRDLLEENFLNNGGTQQEVADQAHALSAIGLIKPTYDLFTNILNGLADNIGGFYLPWSKEIFVIGGRFSGVERWVYSHEFDHALVDQHYHFDAMGVYPVCQSNEDRCTAIRALIEGDATVLMGVWLNQYAGPKDYQDILSYTPPRSTLPEQFPPPYTYLDGSFPYVEGASFVRFLYNRGNWAEVNRAYERLPESTEQILHPQKYLAGEAPIEVAAPDWGPLLGGDWRRLQSDRLGEWKTYLLLGYGADFAAQLSDSTAAAAAEGWGGDSVQVYYSDAADETVLIVHWVWDTPADAAAFHTAMLAYLEARFRAEAVDHPQGSCWAANELWSCAFDAARETLWLLGPDRERIDLILGQYPQFK